MSRDPNSMTMRRNGGRQHFDLFMSEGQMHSKTLQAIFVVIELVASLAVRPATALALTQSDTVRVTLEQARSRLISSNPELASKRREQATSKNLSKPFTGIQSDSAPKGHAGDSAGIVDLRRHLVGRLDRAFFELAALTRKISVSKEALAEDQQLAKVGQQQIAENSGDRLEYNLLIVGVGRSRSRIIEFERERRAVELEMKNLLGIATAHILPVLDKADSEWMTQRLSNAGGEAHPQSRVLPPINADSLTAIALKRRMDVPIVAIQRPADEDSKAYIEKKALADRIRTEVFNAAAAYTLAESGLEAFRTTVLASARQNRNQFEAAYRGSKVGLLALLLVRDQMYDAELDYWTVWVVARKARASIAEATAENLTLTEQVIEPIR